MYKVILFDLWDTLARISNLDDLVKKAKILLGANRYDELFKQFVEWHLVTKTQEQFLTDLDKKISIDKREVKIINNFLAPEQYELYPETKEALTSLKNTGVKLVLVTNSPPTSKIAFEKLDLSNFFDKTVFSCDIGLMKPDKAIFEYAIKDFTVKPNEVLMVGDSLDKDVKGAINARLNAILLDRKGLTQYENKVADLLELVKRMNKITSPNNE